LLQLSTAAVNIIAYSALVKQLTSIWHS